MRIALENMPEDDFTLLDTLLSEYDPGFLGLCFDSGHANLGGDSFEQLKRLKDRLIAVHLHDNDGSRDQHKIPFTGTVNWADLASVMASSAYAGCVNLEVIIKESGYQDEDAFLRQSFLAGERLASMIASSRQDLKTEK